MRWAGPLCLLSAAACADPALRVIGEVPAEVTHAALLVEHQGSVLASSGLLPWRTDAATEGLLPSAGAIPEGATAIVVGYAPLPEAIRYAYDDLGDRPLRRATPGAPRLPPADWASSGMVLGGTAELTQDPGPLALTFDGLPECTQPILGPQVGVVDCAGSYCRGTAEPLGCQTRVAVACEAIDRRYTVTIDRSETGGMSAQLDDAPCESAREDPDGAVRTTCGGCRSTFYPLPQPPFGSLASLNLVDEATGEPLGGPADEHGWLVDFAPLPGCGAVGVVVVRQSPAPSAPAPRLVLVDLERLEVTAARTYPELDFLAVEPNPSGDGFFAVVAEAGGSSLVRFGCSVEVRAQVPIERRPLDRPARLWASGPNEAPELLLAYAVTSTGTHQGRLAAIDPRDLHTTRSWALPDFVRVFAVEPMPNERIAVSGDILTPTKSGSVLWLIARSGDTPIQPLDPGDRSLSERATSLAARATPPAAFGVFADPVSEAAVRYASLSPGLEEPGFRGRIQDYAASSRPSAIRALGDGRAVLTLVPPGAPGAPPEGDTVGVLLDLNEERLLGGRTPIGYGPALIAAHSEGATYFLLPWTGTLVRWRPGP